MITSPTNAVFRLVWLLVLMAVLLFVLAGTLFYWQAWLYLALFFTAALAVTLYMRHFDPALYERRMRGGPGAETQAAQKVIMTLATLGFASLLAVPALDHRYGWSAMPAAVSLLGDFGFAAGYLVVFSVFRVNSFAAATIALHEGQKVISTGPYALIRHPMYAGGSILLAATPLALGSWWGLLVLAPLMPVFIWRLLDEERFLKKNLEGYRAYCATVRYRLLPGVW